MPSIDSSTQNLISDLIAISRHYGADPEFVLAGGGNTSVKTEDRLWVKGSGHALATIDAEGFVEMDRAALDDLLHSGLPEDPIEREAQFTTAIMAARRQPEKGQRPSVEVVLHHLLPCRLVVHSHATLVNMVTCSRDGESLARTLLGDQVLWIPYVDPGYILARTLHDALQEYEKRTGCGCPPVVLMQNHGLIVCSDTTEEIHRQTDQVISAIREHLATIPAENVFGPVAGLEDAAARQLINVIGPALRGLLAEDEALKIVMFDDSPAVLALAGGEAGQDSAHGGPLIPDQIVYCKSFPLWFEPEADAAPPRIVEHLREAVRQHTSATRFAPNVVLVKGLGLFAAGDDCAGADTVRLVYTDAIKVMAGARRMGAVNPLTPREYGFIEDWEVEAYRRKVSAGAAGRGRAAGKVAVVTGAAQGFGLEIAQDLAAQGAHVALSDMNVAGAQQAAAQINESSGGRCAVGLSINVTSGESVEEALHQVVRTWGGLDLLISNAGVLKAGSVKEQSERDFDFVTAVNYKGYFVCVQKTAPILAVQHLAKPGYWSDIIQINSKSGLVGSNKNGAYAGSKFGGIGLTQSFALELVEDGIKVNSICPGNFLDGPLWSDPENGLFVQYLRTGKVPGAKTIEDVRRSYESKVPMNRGCTTPDVMKAVYYLMEQKYETGQALPVTGGQVMLS